LTDDEWKVVRQIGDWYANAGGPHTAFYGRRLAGRWHPDTEIALAAVRSRGLVAATGRGRSQSLCLTAAGAEVYLARTTPDPPREA
jgi:hypothetical protein